MKTRTLLKFSLITTLIGIYLVIVLANNLEPNITKISDINENMIDEWVRIKGDVTNQRNINGLTIFTVYDGTAGIRAVIYKDVGNFEGAEVIILGKIFEYKDEIEIEINKIEVVR
ncbi:MAG: hypothetical protein IB618_03200 [Candidatus Pacearchaeota archaeon]|nr:MAG: hypothetical protein IB618_03200 [Candidatus Pacearchaeota archaeon]